MCPMCKRWGLKDVFFFQSNSTSRASLATLAAGQSNLDIARESYRNPAATRFITFNPYPTLRQLADLEWTWRVNISDGRSNPFDNESSDLKFTERAPPNSTLAEAVPELGNQSFCTDCVDAIIRSTGSNNGGPCESPGGSWEMAPECASSLGYMYSSRLVSGKQFGDLRKARSGEAFTGLSSRDYSDLNKKTLYENYLNGIHLILLNAPVDLIRDPNGGFRTEVPKSLLCVRVNTSQREVNDDKGGGSDGSNGDGDGGSGSGEGNEGGNGSDGGNAAGRDAAPWWTMTGALSITAVIGVAL
ncbi:hypothetical protein QBC36DRAFT_347682 [Triangularia setosa]|uniref:Uncharacterized protein n=1 Tax=Triangularia setosa TaxID=2587417 RepID=A0AAN7A649_9PEZI|nr:hypothetical protein QBC36DRAFT_347682 [Podospora setosa]